MENNDRREFLKKSIIGISGAALLPSALDLNGDRSVVADLPVGAQIINCNYKTRNNF